MRVSILSVIVATGLLLPRPGASAAQSAPAASPHQASVTPAASVVAPPQAPPLEPQGYTYNPESRRDPFVSLVRRGSDALRVTTGTRPPGLAGLSSGEITLKGVVASRSGYVAMVQGADNKTYVVHSGETLLDGTIRTITANAIVILQQVNDPLSLQKQREVRKVLRETEEAR